MESRMKRSDSKESITSTSTTKTERVKLTPICSLLTYFVYSLKIKLIALFMMHLRSLIQVQSALMASLVK